MYCKNVISILFKCVSLTDLIVLKNAIWILDSCVSPRYLFVLKNCIWILDSYVSLRDLFVLKKCHLNFWFMCFTKISFCAEKLHLNSWFMCFTKRTFCAEKNAIWILDSCVSLRDLTVLQKRHLNSRFMCFTKISYTVPLDRLPYFLPELPGNHTENITSLCDVQTIQYSPSYTRLLSIYRTYFIGLSDAELAQCIHTGVFSHGRQLECFCLSQIQRKQHTV